METKWIVFLIAFAITILIPVCENIYLKKKYGEGPYERTKKEQMVFCVAGVLMMCALLVCATIVGSACADATRESVVQTYVEKGWCTNCSAKIDDNFCVKCGTEIARCIECGTKAIGEFCGHCGAAIK